MTSTSTIDVIKKGVVQYADSNGDELRGILFVKKELSSASPLPAVLVFHAFAGITEFEENQAARLAQHGCVVFCTDVYGVENRADTEKGWFDILGKFRSDRAGLMRRRLQAAIDYINALGNIDKRRIGAIGFCFGGCCVLDLARTNVGLSAVVSFHGVFAPLPDQPKPENLPKISASVLICHGDEDLHVSQEQWLGIMNEMRKRGADWQFINYGNAKHSFTHPESDLRNAPGVGYNEQAATRSWAAMLNLFQEKGIL